MNTSKIQSNELQTIHISIKDSSEILSPYAEDNMQVINSEFANFLDNAVKDTSVKSSLKLEITAPICDTATVSKAIKNYYSNELVDTSLKLKQNLMFSMINLMIGLFALAVTIILSTLDIPVVSGVLDIFAWVFVWEAVDQYFFRRVELRYQKRRQTNFINAEIVYLQPTVCK